MLIFFFKYMTFGISMIAINRSSLFCTKTTSWMNKICLRNCESCWVVSLFLSLILILRSLFKWKILIHLSLKISNIEGGMFNHLFPHSIVSFQILLVSCFNTCSSFEFVFTPSFCLMVSSVLRHLLPSLGKFHLHLCLGLV